MIGVDVGGTFTDVVRVEGSRISVTKVPTDLESSDRSVLSGAQELNVETAEVFNLASTAGLNAVITRRTPKIAFLTTLGHRDMLDQARFSRPLSALTDPRWHREFGDAARPLVRRYLRRGIKERISGRGEVIVPLDETQARQELRVMARCDIEGVAICLMNAYINHEHEQQLRDLVVDELGDIPCSISSEVSPLAKEFERATTTVVDAVMKVKYAEYTDRLITGLGKAGFEGSFSYADCAARLLPVDYAMERPYRLVVGGPAAGTAASAHFGAKFGYPQLLCADVGGTSCDISLVIDGAPRLNSTFELEHELHVTALSTDVITIGAGGGSIVWVTSSGDIAVGPDSAGASPGPACYGQGGQRPTLTDAALLIGILDADQFLGGRVGLKPELSHEAFAALASPLPVDMRVDYAWRTGIQNIAEGILNICVRHGLDVREFSLMAFGAAGGMLLPSLLQVLPLRSVVVPPHPGLFSALGLLSTDQVFSDHRTAYTLLTANSAPEINKLYREMETKLLGRAGGANPGARLHRSFDARLVGQSTETPFIDVPEGLIDESAIAAMVDNFHLVYEQRNGNAFTHLPVQGVTFRVEMHVQTSKVDFDPIPASDGGILQPTAKLRLHHLGGETVIANEFHRDHCRSGDRIDGPAVVREPMSTTFVPEGLHLCVGGHGELVIEVSA